jgi:hypothetical protein
MANKKTPEITPVGDAGLADDGRTATIDDGILWSDGRVGLSGSELADRVTGTDKPDIYAANGAKSTVLGKPGTETIRLGAGKDTVVLPGQDGDYIARHPKLHESPPASNKQFWGDKQFGYGRTIVMESVTTGEKYIMSDVDRVVFANGKLDIESKNVSDTQSQSPVTPDKMDQMEKAIKDGKVTAVSSRELLARVESGMTPQQKIDARIASTLEAQSTFDKRVAGGPGGGPRATTEQAWDKVQTDVIKELRGKDPKILERPLELLDIPDATTGSTQRLHVSAPAPGR